MREAIKKEKPNKVSCDADELDIYSLQDSLAVFFQYPPRYPLIDIYSQSQQEEPLIVPATSLLVAMASMTRQFVFSSAFNCAFGCGLPVCSLDSGRWRSTSQSWHVQAQHLVFCFEQLLTMLRFRLMSLFTTFWCLMYFCSFAASEHTGQTAMVSWYHQRECESQLS